MPAPLRLALVEDDPHVRALLHEYLSYQPEFECVIVADSAEAFLAELEVSLPPRLVLLDLSLPGQSGLQLLPLLKQKLPQADVLVQTMHDDDARIGQALRAGATGYLIKSATSLQQYKQALLDVAAGGAVFTPLVARRALAHFVVPQPSHQPELLSAREQEVLQALLDGLSEKEVAARLAVSPLTVRTYVRRLYEKLHVHSRTELLSRVARGEL
ncbi:MAG: response regulator transcription factor [Janthinobacterium lividum]